MKREKKRCAMGFWKNGWRPHPKFKNRLETMRPCTDAADVAPCIKVESNGTYLQGKSYSVCHLNSHFFGRNLIFFFPPKDLFPLTAFLNLFWKLWWNVLQFQPVTGNVPLSHGCVSENYFLTDYFFNILIEYFFIPCLLYTSLCHVQRGRVKCL